MPDDALMPDNVKVEQLDQAIDALLAGSAAPANADPELAALAQIAASLRELARRKFPETLEIRPAKESNHAYFDRCTRS